MHFFGAWKAFSVRFSGAGTALSSGFGETKAKCNEQALENAVRLGRRLRELDLSSEIGVPRGVLRGFEVCRFRLRCLGARIQESQG